jgi:branched-chain amino acid transport system ATP-binding protein
LTTVAPAASRGAEAPAPTAGPSPLALYDIRAGYGRIEVLHGIDLALRPGEVTALLGPNGAGKTTALSVMSGLISPASGCCHVRGHHINDADADALARIGICHVREGRSVFPNLTVADNLVAAASSGVSLPRLSEVAFGLFPRLKDRRKQLAGTLSGGEKQMLALACGLGVEPSALLVDELSMGLAPRVVAELYDAVAEVAQAGVSVLVVEQFATIGLRWSSQVHVMAHGTIVHSGPSTTATDAIHTAYLGVGAP